MTRRFVLNAWRGVLLLLAATAVLIAPNAWALQAIPTTGKITLGVKLDEADWQRAPISSSFIENMPNEKALARFKSEVRVLFAASAPTQRC